MAVVKVFRTFVEQVLKYYTCVSGGV